MSDSGRKPRWWLRILVIIVALLALAGAAELALRLILPNVIAGAVRNQLGLSGDHPVDVQLGGSALAHAVTGHVGQVSVDVDGLAVMDQLRGDLRMSADSVPFNVTGGEMAGTVAQFTVQGEDLPAAVSVLTGGIADSGEVQGGSLVVGRTVQIFGIDVPVTVTLGLAVEGGDVLIDPTAVSAAGAELTAEQVDSLVQVSAQRVCIKDRLPAGVTLTGIDLSSTGAVTVTAKIAPDIASNPEQRSPGSCAG